MNEAEPPARDNEPRSTVSGGIGCGAVSDMRRRDPSTEVVRKPGVVSNQQSSGGLQSEAQPYFAAHGSLAKQPRETPTKPSCRDTRWGSRQGATPPSNSTPHYSRPGLSPQNGLNTYLELRPEPDPGPLLDHRDASFSARDLGVLVALDQYRYLDTDQIAQLFFTGRRCAQRKLLRLRTYGIITGWRCLVQPGFHPRPSVHVLAAAGARLLARVTESDPRPLIDRARHARSRTFHLAHDLEANGFFVSLAGAAGALPDQGLYHWVGERRCRAAKASDGAPPSDGWGRYLFEDREVCFDLEWDRDTENDRRLKSKARAYVRYLRGRRDAGRQHVLFVAPHDDREAELQRIIKSALPSVGECCRFYTAATALLEEHSPLGRVWLPVGSRQARRIAFAEMAGMPRSDRRVEDCIAKPSWWERRRRGGEGA